MAMSTSNRNCLSGSGMQRFGCGKAGFKGLEGDGRGQAGGDDDERGCNHAASLNEAAVEIRKAKDPL